MKEIYLAVVNMSISSIAMILAVLILRATIKSGSKSVRCILWVPVGILLVVPILSGKESFLTSVDSFSQESAGETVEAVQIAEASSGFDETNETLMEISKNAGLEKASAILTDAQSDTESGGTEENIQARLESNARDGVAGKIWALLSDGIAGESSGILQIRLSEFAVTVGTAVWLCGCAVLLLHTWIRYFLLMRKLRVSVCIYENIFICDEIDTPFVLGGLRPHIYLPSRMQKQQIPYVVAHERAHLCRRDDLWKMAAFLLLTIHWFNPFVWAAFHSFCKDIELACDERVIRRYQMADKKAYADALLSCSVQKKVVFATPLSFGMIGIKERIVFIVKKEESEKKKMIWNAISCTMLLLCFFVVVMTRTTSLALEMTDSYGSGELSDDKSNGKEETEAETALLSFEYGENLDIIVDRGVTVYQYTGEAIEPPVLLLFYHDPDGKYDILQENEDYTIAYEDNTEVGTGEIIITGTGDYCGEARVEFTIIAPIEEIKIDSANFPDDLFRAYVSRNFDTDHNGVLNEEEILDVRDIDLTECYDPCSGIYVKDVTGAVLLTTGKKSENKTENGNAGLDKEVLFEGLGNNQGNTENGGE